MLFHYVFLTPRGFMWVGSSEFGGAALFATTHMHAALPLFARALFVFARPVFAEQRRKGEMRWWLMVVVLQRGMMRHVGRGEETLLEPRGGGHPD